jgi:hypothetical protein
MRRKRPAAVGFNFCSKLSIKKCTTAYIGIEGARVQEIIINWYTEVRVKM